MQSKSLKRVPLRMIDESLLALVQNVRREYKKTAGLALQFEFTTSKQNQTEWIDYDHYLAVLADAKFPLVEGPDANFSDL